MQKENINIDVRAVEFTDVEYVIEAHFEMTQKG